MQVPIPTIFFFFLCLSCSNSNSFKSRVAFNYNIQTVGSYQALERCSFRNSKYYDRLKERAARMKYTNEIQKNCIGKIYNFHSMRSLSSKGLNAHCGSIDLIDDRDRNRNITEQKANADGIFVKFVKKNDVTLGKQEKINDDSLEIVEITNQPDHVKSLIFVCAGQPVVVVIRSFHTPMSVSTPSAEPNLWNGGSVSERVDCRRLADALFASGLMGGDMGARGKAPVRCKLAAAEEAEAWTGFKIGSIPPFNHRRPMPIFVDESVLRLLLLLGS